MRHVSIIQDERRPLWTGPPRPGHSPAPGLLKGKSRVATVTATIVIAAGAMGFVAACSGTDSTHGSANRTRRSDVSPACTYSLQIALKVGAIQTAWIDEDGPVKINPLVSQTEALDQAAAAVATDPEAKQAFEKAYSDIKAFGNAYTTAYRSGVNYGNGYDNSTGQAVEKALSSLVNDDSQRDSLHLCS